MTAEKQQSKNKDKSKEIVVKDSDLEKEIKKIQELIERRQKSKEITSEVLDLQFTI